MSEKATSRIARRSYCRRFAATGPGLRRCLIVVATLLGAIGCRHSARSRRASDNSAAADPPKAVRAQVDVAGEKHLSRDTESLNLIDELSGCEVDQLGPVVEIGTADEQARLGYDLTPGNLVQSVDRNGGKFVRIYGRRLAHEFWLDEPMERPKVTVRLAGVGAARVIVSLDKTVIGTSRLFRGEPVTRAFGPIEGIVEPGRHTVSLEFHGQSRNSGEPTAEIDWIHLGQPLDSDAVPLVPTLRTLVADQNIGGIPKRSIVLRAPSSVRCPLLLTAAAHLRMSLGFWGSGAGLGEIRIIEDGQPPLALRQQKTQGGNGAEWTPLDVDLSPFANHLVGLEFRALRASQGGRVAFGEPTISRVETTPAFTPTHARLVVIVVAAGLSRQKIPPWGPLGTFAPLGHLLADSAAFQNYRASSTVPASVLATLLTGLAPAAHRLEDTGARLSPTINTLQGTVKQASGRTGLFTGVPTTFAAFGFNSGWDEMQTFSPVKDQAASEPLSQATRWLQSEFESEDNTRRFILVHVRGMHPPWDLTKEAVAGLHPPEYGGPLDARRGGITLGRIRRQTPKSFRRLSDQDWIRLDSLTTSAFLDQVQALDQLLSFLKHRKLWQETLFILVGDVASGAAPNVPFDPVGSLREDQLMVPLLVKFPGNTWAGRSIDAPVTTADITRTVLDAFGLELPEEINAYDLGQTAADHGPITLQPQLATLGNRYASRLANWLLFGEIGKEPALCELYVDPACTANHFTDHPWTARTAWLWTRNELGRDKAMGAKLSREAASIDPDTSAALMVWGDID